MMGFVALGIALFLVVVSMSATGRAHAAPKPDRVPEFHEFGRTDEERVAGVAAWKRANYAPDAYIGASVRSRHYYAWAWVFTLIGAALLFCT